MIKRIPDKVRILLIPLAIILAIIFVSILFLGPQISGILAGQKEVSLQKAKLAQLTAKAAFLEGLQESELEIKTKTVLAFLPAEKDLPRVLTTIRNLAGYNGLELQGVQVGPGNISTDSASPKPEKNALELLQLKIVIGGDWAQLKNFLSQLEEASPLMRIVKANISSFPPAVEATLVLDSFSLPLPTTLGASETPLVAISPQEEEVYRQLVKIVPPTPEFFQPSSFPSGRENPFIF